MRVEGNGTTRRAWLAFVALLVTAACQGAASDAGATGSSPPCTRVGTANADVIRGTAGRDVICGRGGDDRLLGRGGEDILRGGGGDDTILGQSGQDSLDGGSGSDVLTGGLDDDEAVGHSGNDVLTGGEGDDRLLGGSGEDQLKGETGDDELLGQPDDDDLSGGPGDDSLDGGPGDDEIDGGTGNNDCVTDSGDTIASCDSAPPEITQLSISPDSIDTGEQSQTVTVTIGVRDELSGIGPGWANTIYINGPDGQHFDQGLGSFDRVSGTAQDGVYETKFPMARFSAQGTWRLLVSLQDGVGNNESLATDDLAELGFPHEFEQTAPGDTSAPVIQSMSLDRDSVDASLGDQDINVTAHITDDLSGNAPYGSGMTRAWFVSPSGTQQTSVWFSDQELVSGDARDGTYVGDLYVPAYAEQGFWKLSYIDVGDFAGNTTRLEGDELAAAGLPDGFEQTGPGDTTPPKLESFSFDPKTIDTSQSDQTIVATFHITDDVAGFGDTKRTGGVGSFSFTSPSTHHYAWANIWDYDFVSGTPTDAIYKSTITIPRYSEPGEWRIGGITLEDRAFNYTYVDTSNFGDLGFDTVFENVPGSSPPPDQ